MNEGYKFLEDIAIADLAFEVNARSIEDLFRYAGKAITNAMVLNLDSIERKEVREFEVIAQDLELLLFNFLQELIYYKDTENILFSEFEIKIYTNDKKIAKVKAYGEKLDPKKHDTLVDVKAVTMHMFELKEKNGNWFARVILDV
ncbi:MAG: archease [Thermoproteota archaeon]|jgi:SHS2 domain-containing protein|nr:archease [Thermoproteota archaeon]